MSLLVVLMLLTLTVYELIDMNINKDPKIAIKKGIVNEDDLAGKTNKDFSYIPYICVHQSNFGAKVNQTQFNHFLDVDFDITGHNESISVGECNITKKIDEDKLIKGFGDGEHF